MASRTGKIDSAIVRQISASCRVEAQLRTVFPAGFEHRRRYVAVHATIATPMLIECKVALRNATVNELVRIENLGGKNI
jgi:hypothetical protein